MPSATETDVQPDLALWGAIALAAVALVVVTVVVLRRRPQRDEDSSVFPPSTGDEGVAQVRLLEGDDTAHRARIDALRGEVQSLRREAAYAAQRGLDRRAERLEELIAEREEQLKQHHDRAS